MLDGITERARLALSILCCILLAAEHNRLGAVHLIYIVHSFREPPELLTMSCVIVGEVGLHCCLLADAGDYHSGTLVFILRAEYPPETFQGSLDDFLSAVDGCEESLTATVAILWKVGAEPVGIYKNRYQ